MRSARYVKGVQGVGVVILYFISSYITKMMDVYGKACQAHKPVSMVLAFLPYDTCIKHH
jgi:hypothetical protein